MLSQYFFVALREMEKNASCNDFFASLDLKVIGKSDFNGEFTLTYMYVLVIGDHPTAVTCLPIVAGSVK